MLQPYDFPPGIYANGTDLEAEGRWRDGNLVRWYNGHLRPVGGWQRFTSSPLPGTPRSLFTWRQNDATPRLAIGTEANLFIHDGSLAYDITPVGLSAGRTDGNFGTGFGADIYGNETYGTPRTGSGLVMDATVWDLDSWGQDLMALSPADGRICHWVAPATGTRAVFLALAPPVASTLTTSASGGTLAANTYYYVVTALNASGETIASNELHVATTGSTSSNTITWAAVTGATGYRIYRGTAAGAESVFYSVGAVTTYTDTNAASTAASPPATNTASFAPINNRGMFVSDERFLFALGADGDPRNISWSSQEDYTTWLASDTNSAGSLQLQTNGVVMNARKMPGEALIFTDTDVHQLQYIGSPFIYGIKRVGTNCGLIGRKAHIANNSICVWMGTRNFYIYDGATVQTLDCDVQEYVFDNLNLLQGSKVVAGVNALFNEFWWLYPSGSSIENDTIVVWNYKSNWWAYHKLARVGWVDKEVWPYPMAGDPSGNLYQHEDGWTASNSPRVGTIYATTGPFDLGGGELILDGKQLIPDTNKGGNASINFTFTTKLTPNDPNPVVNGPYAFTRTDGFVDIRITGRQATMNVTNATDGLFQVGVLRIDVSPTGGRR